MTTRAFPGPDHYHHHSLHIKGTTDLLETRREGGFSITLRKIRGHIHSKRNDLADAAAQLVVRNFVSLPPAHTLRVEVGSIAPRPPLWVMFTHKPQTPPSPLSNGLRHATLRLPWRTILEAGRLQMHAFTRPYQQLRLKVRATTLRGLHHT
jgi:hypothetical protein